MWIKEFKKYNGRKFPSKRGGFMNTSLTKRVAWIDNVKFICIFFVMVSHLDCTPRIFRVFFEPFFLAAFYFVSGYVYKNQVSIKEVIQKKARALLIPWFWFGMFNIITSQIISFQEHESLAKELIRNFLQIRGLDDRMWFIAALFVAHIPFYFLVKYCNRNRRVVITIVMFILSFVYSFFVDGNLFPWGTNKLPWHLEYIFIINFFMVMGYEYKNLDEKLAKKIDEKKNIIIVMCIYILLVVANYIGKCTISDVFIHAVPMTIILAICGVMLCIEVSKLIPNNKLISYIGKNTLIYYGLHGKLESIIEAILRKVGIYENICANAMMGILIGVAIVVFVSIVLLIPTWIINKYLLFVIGKKRTTNT